MPNINKKEFDAIFHHLENVTSQLKHMDHPSEVVFIAIPKGQVFAYGESWTDVIINATKHIEENIDILTKDDTYSYKSPNEKEPTNMNRFNV